MKTSDASQKFYIKPNPVMTVNLISWNERTRSPSMLAGYKRGWKINHVEMVTCPTNRALLEIYIERNVTTPCLSSYCSSSSKLYPMLFLLPYLIQNISPCWTWLKHIFNPSQTWIDVFIWKYLALASSKTWLWCSFIIAHSNINIR